MLKGQKMSSLGRLNISDSRKLHGIIPPSRKGIKVSDETKKKISESLKKIVRKPEQYKKMAKSISGENHWKWKGGRALCKICGKKMRTVRGIKCMECRIKDSKRPLFKKIRESKEYKLWRTAVFERDNFTCVWCGIRNEKGLGKTIIIQADHIKPFAYFPELRFAIDNGRTLCKECHKTTATYGGKSKGRTHWDDVDKYPPTFM